jgi:phage gp37-like protein
MLLETETALINKLAELFPQLKVEAYPDNPESYRLVHPIGALLVRYAGEVSEDTGVQQILVQFERSVWNVVVVSRGLRSHTGAYPVIDAVKDGLGGKIISGGTLRPAGVRFLSEAGGVWYHAVAFELKQRVNYKI